MSLSRFQSSAGTLICKDTWANKSRSWFERLPEGKHSYFVSPSGSLGGTEDVASWQAAVSQNKQPDAARVITQDHRVHSN